MTQNYDAIIIGAGISGAAIAYELSKKGYKTVNVEMLTAAGHGSTANTFTKNLPASGSLTFHTTNELSGDGVNYTPTNLGNVGSAEIVSLDGRDIVGLQ